jgi:hypothetical protein
MGEGGGSPKVFYKSPALVSKFLPKRQIPQPSKSIISCYSRRLSVLISYDRMRYKYLCSHGAYKRGSDQVVKICHHQPSRQILFCCMHDIFTSEQKKRGTQKNTVQYIVHIYLYVSFM